MKKSFCRDLKKKEKKRKETRGKKWEIEGKKKRTKKKTGIFVFFSFLSFLLFVEKKNQSFYFFFLRSWN